jgi:hypothetical protein
LLPLSSGRIRDRTGCGRSAKRRRISKAFHAHSTTGIPSQEQIDELSGSKAISAWEARFELLIRNVFEFVDLAKERSFLLTAAKVDE